MTIGNVVGREMVDSVLFNFLDFLRHKRKIRLNYTTNPQVEVQLQLHTKDKTFHMLKHTLQRPNNSDKDTYPGPSSESDPESESNRLYGISGREAH